MTAYELGVTPRPPCLDIGDAAIKFADSVFHKVTHHGESRHDKNQAAEHRRHRLLLRHKQNSRTATDKLSFKKYDPVAKKHVAFKETKIK